jgi:hypothetical protein
VTVGQRFLRLISLGEIAYIKVLESARCQADFHSLSTPDQSVKFVFVRTRPSLIFTIVLVLESCYDSLGVGAQSTRGSIMASGRRYDSRHSCDWTLVPIWMIDDMLYRCRG